MKSIISFVVFLIFSLQVFAFGSKENFIKVVSITAPDKSVSFYKCDQAELHCGFLGLLSSEQSQLLAEKYKNEKLYDGLIVSLGFAATPMISLLPVSYIIPFMAAPALATSVVIFIALDTYSDYKLNNEVIYQNLQQVDAGRRVAIVSEKDLEIIQKQFQILK